MLTDEQTLQAMVLCTTNASCNNCPARGNNKCTRYVMRCAIDLIGRLHTVNDRLRKWGGELADELDVRDIDEYNMACEVRANTIREFAEKLKEKEKVNSLGDGFVYAWEINNIAKEMVGED